MEDTTMRDTYNGWKNRQTWNVALWIGNEESLHLWAVRFMTGYKGRAPYRAFVESACLAGASTPDGIKWDGTTLDYRALNDMMRDLID
jgi:hypothetical protein